MTQCSLAVASNQSSGIPDGGTSDWGCLLIQHSEYQGPTQEIITWFIMCTVCKVFAFRSVVCCVVCACLKSTECISHMYI